MQKKPFRFETLNNMTYHNEETRGKMKFRLTLIDK